MCIVQSQGPFFCMMNLLTSHFLYICLNKMLNAAFLCATFTSVTDVNTSLMSMRVTNLELEKKRCIKPGNQDK